MKQRINCIFYNIKGTKPNHSGLNQDLKFDKNNNAGKGN